MTLVSSKDRKKVYMNNNRKLLSNEQIALVGLSFIAISICLILGWIATQKVLATGVAQNDEHLINAGIGMASGTIAFIVFVLAYIWWDNNIMGMRQAIILATIVACAAAIFLHEGDLSFVKLTIGIKSLGVITIVSYIAKLVTCLKCDFNYGDKVIMYQNGQAPIKGTLIKVPHKKFFGILTEQGETIVFSFNEIYAMFHEKE